MPVKYLGNRRKAESDFYYKNSNVIAKIMIVGYLLHFKYRAKSLRYMIRNHKISIHFVGI